MIPPFIRRLEIIGAVLTFPVWFIPWLIGWLAIHVIALVLLFSCWLVGAENGERSFDFYTNPDRFIGGLSTSEKVVTFMERHRIRASIYASLVAGLTWYFIINLS